MSQEQNKIIEVKDKKGLWIKTFGCQMNEYDSEKVLALLSDGYRPVETPEEATVAFINTCSVRDKAEHKLYSLLGRLRDLKNDNPDLVIGVGGCVAQQEGKAIISRSPTVDFVVGTHNLSLVPSLIKQAQETKTRGVAVNYREEWEELSPQIDEYTKDVLEFGASFRALVSIQRGCSKHCSFCVVPTTRGEQVSRDPAEILREIKLKVNLGAKEVLLLGQTVNSFGLDLSPRYKFEKLIRDIAEIPGVKRIRFSSPHPQEVKPEFIELYGDVAQLCPHIHLPLQSGSDRILKLMNRNYRRGRYLEIVESLRARMPGISITTDVIVGFPTETEQDFEDSLDIMRQVSYSGSFSFMYSRRPNTKAITFDKSDEIEISVAHERLLRLQELQDQICTKENAKWLGKTVEVLAEGSVRNLPSAKRGRIPENTLVEILEGEAKPGDLVKIKVDYTSSRGLKGTIVEDKWLSMKEKR